MIIIIIILKVVTIKKVRVILRIWTYWNLKNEKKKTLTKKYKNRKKLGEVIAKTNGRKVKAKIDRRKVKPIEMEGKWKL